MTVLLVGSGRTAHFLARRFADDGHPVTLVVDTPDEARRINREIEGVTVVVGDGARPDVLDGAGALHARALVAFTAEDHRNLVACQVARRVFSVERTIALVADPENREVFRRLGLDVAVSVTDLLADLLARETLFDALRAHEVFAQGRILVSEVELAADSPAAGRALSRLGELPGLVAAVMRNGQAFVPKGESLLEVGDRLVVIATQQDHDQLLQVLVGGAGR